MNDIIKQLIKGVRVDINDVNKVLPCKFQVEKEIKKGSIDDSIRQFARLTEREKELVKLIKSGLTNKEISTRINISYDTVKTHRKNIFRKLKIHNVSDLINLNMESYGQNKLD